MKKTKKGKKQKRKKTKRNKKLEFLLAPENLSCARKLVLRQKTDILRINFLSVKKWHLG